MDQVHPRMILDTTFSAAQSCEEGVAARTGRKLGRVRNRWMQTDYLRLGYRAHTSVYYCFLSCITSCVTPLGQCDCSNNASLQARCVHVIAKTLRSCHCLPHRDFTSLAWAQLQQQHTTTFTSAHLPGRCHLPYTLLPASKRYKTRIPEEIPPR